MEKAKNGPNVEKRTARIERVKESPKQVFITKTTTHQQNDEQVEPKTNNRKQKNYI